MLDTEQNTLIWEITDLTQSNIFIERCYFAELDMNLSQHKVTAFCFLTWTGNRPSGQSGHKEVE